jgi:hypothetical protein
MKDEKDIKQYKNGSKGKNPGQAKKRIPHRAWMSVCCDCCVLSGRGFCDGLVQRRLTECGVSKVCYREASKNEAA